MGLESQDTTLGAALRRERALEAPSAEIRQDMRRHALPVVAGAAFLGLLLPIPARGPAKAAPRAPDRPRTVWLAPDALRESWRIPGMRSLPLGCAVPAKLILTAQCFFLVPLILSNEGHSLSSQICHAFCHRKVRIRAHFPA